MVSMLAFAVGGKKGLWDSRFIDSNPRPKSWCSSLITGFTSIQNNLLRLSAIPHHPSWPLEHRRHSTTRSREISHSERSANNILGWKLRVVLQHNVVSIIESDPTLPTQMPYTTAIDNQTPKRPLWPGMQMYSVSCEIYSRFCCAAFCYPDSNVS